MHEIGKLNLKIYRIYILNNHIIYIMINSLRFKQS